ncbi:MAG: hypothetical protein R2726_22030 [Acidimicrobiales bacterium]
MTNRVFSATVKVTPASRAASIISRPWVEVTAIGFSTTTCLPAAMASSTTWWCATWGTITSTSSTSGSASSSWWSVWARAPRLAARSVTVASSTSHIATIRHRSASST